MRRISLLAALLLPLLLPGAAQAGGCPPGVPEGVVDKDVYRLGEIVDFFDSYHDFADPGTVTITFERSEDGATREFTAFNGPDGTWYRQVTFDSAADVGRWDVTVVVDQTDALDTCTDTFIVRATAGLPPTDTEPVVKSDKDVIATLAGIGLVAASVLLAFRRAVSVPKFR
jgi:hypothetical protein